MECQPLSFPILVAFMISVFIILRIWKKSNTTDSPLNLPPGPLKLPVIGNMHQLVGSLPHHRLRELATRYGPLMHVKLGQVSHIVISSPAAAREVMKNHDISFAGRPRLVAGRFVTYNSTNISFAPYGDYWRQLRKVCTLELLSLKRVQSYRSIREEEVSRLIRSISSSAGLPINLSKMVFSLSNDVTARAAFGGRRIDQEAFKKVCEKLVDLLGGFHLADLFPSVRPFLEVLSGIRFKIESVHQVSDKIVASIINEHRASRAMGKTTVDEADDLVDVLLNIQERGELEFPITTDNIKAVILDIFVAGSETSSVTMEWAMSEMLKNPRVLEKAQAEVRKVFGSKGNVDETGLHELQYLKLVIKETLRLHPPVPLLLPRECRESCKILGYDIPAGSRVLVNVWEIGRDPRHWTEAERFYPERFLDGSIDYKGNNLEFIPFGSGRRICPGMSFGMANVELPLAQLLYHFDWKLPVGIKSEDLDMTEHLGLVVRRKNDLHLIPIPYRPLATE